MTNSTNDSNVQKIGNYKIERHIASGGMAAVYLAVDESLQRQVALKVMLPSLAKDADFVQRFQREARAAARLEHPNIVRIYETGLTPAQEPFIAMQYIEGDSLQEALAQLAEQGKVYPTMQALWLVKQVAQALDVAHRAGIVHRDLKPSNILLRRDGTPVLTDMGIATVQGETRLTQTGNIIGTPHYMSPEQVLGKTVDGRSDIYSLGIVLYELLAGQVPFDAGSAIAILHQQAYETPPPLNSKRQGLASQTQLVVNTCLQKDPEQRYQSAAHMVAALEAAIAAEATDRHAAPVAAAYAVTQIDAAPVAAAEKKEKRSYLWLLLLLIPLFLIIFLLFLWQNANTERQALADQATIAAMASTITSQTQEANQQIADVGAREDAEAAAVETTPNQDQASDQSTAVIDQADGSDDAEQVTAVAISAMTETAVAMPTLTPLPTDTPLPTNTVIPTVTFTPAPTPCGISVNSAFTSNHTPQLGCATAGAAAGVWMAQETFENGRMLWRSDNDIIYTIYNNGTWAAYDDIWVEGDPAYACGTEQTPPTPQRGFGKIWCTNANVRTGLGYATAGEAGINGTIQQFENGFIIRPDGGSVRALNYNGTWR